MKDNISSKQILKAYQIKQILASRHTKDFYATEVKTGASWGNDYLMFDGYAIKKSWVNLKYTGYEIKTARGDFKQDNKWRGYLQFCNEFYWVCPKDLIKANEIEDDCGLIYVYPDSYATRIIKKAKYREIEPPTDILLYLIMWRIEQPSFPFFNNKLDFFKYWIERKEFSRDLGYKVSKSFREKLEKIKLTEKENEKLKNQLENYYKIVEICQKHKVYSYFTDCVDLVQLENHLKGNISPDIKRYVDKLDLDVRNLMSCIGAEE